MGGGTTDFSLLSVDSELNVKREKVIPKLLGGDNIDLLIAKNMEADARQKANTPLLVSGLNLRFKLEFLRKNHFLIQG